MEKKNKNNYSPQPLISSVRPGYAKANTHANFHSVSRRRLHTSSIQNKTSQHFKTATDKRQTLSSSLVWKMPQVEYNRGGRERFFGHKEVQRTWHDRWGPFLTHALLWEQRMMSNKSFFFFPPVICPHVTCPFLHCPSFTWFSNISAVQSMWGFSTPPWGGETEEASC